MKFYRFCNAAVLIMVIIFSSTDASSGQEKPWATLEPKEIFTDQNVRDLAEAAAKGNTKKIDELVRLGVSVNSKGLHGLIPLFSAVVAQNKAGVERLLALGADPNLRSEEGGAVIHTATHLIKDSTFLKLILAHGGNPNLLRGNDGKVPLHLAISSEDSYQSMEKIKLLLDAGANVNVRDKRGETPLMDAAKLYRFDLTYKLLESGADYSIQNNWGVSILSYVNDVPMLDARKEQVAWHEKTIQFLKLKGVDMKGK